MGDGQAGILNRRFEYWNWAPQMARLWRMAAVATAFFGTAAAYGAADPSAKGLLSSLDHGDWELRIRNDNGAKRHICFDGGLQLVQLGHAGMNCKSVVLSNTPEQITVQYTCPGQGYGRTSIRRETHRLVQIDSQGIAQGVPFAFAAEARRVGACRP